MVASGTGAPKSAGTPEDWKTRKEVFQHSYAEVLAAIKHQDDKLGRALTAQAFLTAAGITIFTQLGDQTPGLTFGGQALTVPRLFFMTFLVSIVLALGFTLSAIGPSTPYREPGKPGKTSLIFYSFISNDDKWSKYIDRSGDQLVKMLAENYHSEACDLAKRVNYKVARSREAAAFVNLAVTSLAVLGVFSLSGISAMTRWWIASGVLLLSSSLPLWDLFHMRRLKFPEGHPDRLAYYLLVSAVTFAGAGLGLAPSHDAQWLTLFFTLGLVLASRWGLVGSGFARTLLGATALGGFAIVVVVIFLL